MPLVPPQGYLKIANLHRRGLLADRPAATDVVPGTLYYSTDLQVIDVCDGAGWSSYSSIPSGNWTDVTFSSSNFTAGAMSWTIVAGNIAANNYTLIEKTLIWNIVISGTTLAAPLGNVLTMYFPASATSSHYVQIPFLYNNTGVWATGVAVVNPSSTGVLLYKNDVSNYAAGTLYLTLQIIVPIV